MTGNRPELPVVPLIDSWLPGTIRRCLWWRFSAVGDVVECAGHAVGLEDGELTVRGKSSFSKPLTKSTLRSPLNVAVPCVTSR